MEFFETADGDRGVPLEAFAKNHVRPAIDDKRTIRSGYLDLLYFQYREDKYRERRSVLIIRAVLCVMACLGIWTAMASPVAALAIFVLFIVIGALALHELYVNRNQVNLYHGYRTSVRDQLRELGIGVSEYELNTRIWYSSSFEMPIGKWAKSRLGIVKPMLRSGLRDPEYAFNIFDDDIYRAK